MRLFEVEDRFSNDLATVLRNVSGRTDKLRYEALGNLLRNLGYGGIDYKIFNQIYDNSPGIQELVSDFDQDGITLASSDNTPKQVDQQLDTTGNSPSVKAMARSANPYI